MLRARDPDETGFAERDGVSVYWELLGDGDRTVLFLPTWTLLHSRCWKMQLPYFSRHDRVLTFDPRGNGKSDRPSDPAAYAEAEFAVDALAVMDATGTDRAAIVGLSMGAQRGLLLAADHPERVSSAAFIGPAVPLGTGIPERKKYPFDERHDTTEGWAKSNRYHWVEGGYEDYGEFLVATYDAPAIGGRQATLEVCARVRCPVLVIHGGDDAIISHSAGAGLAEATGG